MFLGRSTAQRLLARLPARGSTPAALLPQHASGPHPLRAPGRAFSTAGAGGSAGDEPPRPFTPPNKGEEGPKKPEEFKFDFDDMVDEDKEKQAQAPPKAAAIEEPEQAVGSAQRFGFQAETRQLLDIVARSLYTDKEVFIRELISNASDALEKLRYLQLSAQGSAGLSPSELEPRIGMTVDPAKLQFCIQDTGIGMTREELVEHLGTIAQSGSKAFLKQMRERNADGTGGADSSERIIGQFGVGFYSVFMVAKSVRVYTKSAQQGSKGYLWESDGNGEYTITEADGVTQGTKIILNLKDTESSFSNNAVVERIIKKYSNFVGFPIALNGVRVNTVEALWRKGVSSVTEEEHREFYKLLSKDSNDPLFRLHYKVDVPLQVSALLYVPQSSGEKFGFARTETNVNLYSRKVLIQAKAKQLLPEWLRFVHGVVDSEDIPLNISREATQDSALMRRLNNMLAKKVLGWLDEQARKDPASFAKFFREFGTFIKEGVCSDFAHKDDAAKLLRFETTHTEEGQLISLDEYVARMRPGQKRIYYLVAPFRSAALASPYYEPFKKKDVEVLLLYQHVDEFLMGHLDQYKKTRVKSIEAEDLDLEEVKAPSGQEADPESLKEATKRELSAAQSKLFGQWLKKTLGATKLLEARPSARLSDSPAVIVGHQAASITRMMTLLNQQGGQAQGQAPKILEFNPRHATIRKLYALSQSHEPGSVALAQVLAEQTFDNALIAAGLLDEPRTMLQRLNTLVERALHDVSEVTEETTTTTTAAAGTATGGDAPQGKSEA